MTNACRILLFTGYLFTFLNCASVGTGKAVVKPEPEMDISVRDTAEMFPAEAPPGQDSISLGDAERLLRRIVAWKLQTDSIVQAIELQSDLLSWDDRLFISNRLKQIAQTVNALLVSLEQSDSSAAATLEPLPSEITSPPELDCSLPDSNVLQGMGATALLDSCLGDWEKGKAGSRGMEILDKITGDELSPALRLRALSALARLKYLAGEREAALSLWSRLGNVGPEIDNVLKTAQQQLKILRLLDEVPDSETKRLVKELNRKYLGGNTHAEISDQALSLLNRIQTRELRKEIKKLVSSAWERDGEQVGRELAEIRRLASSGHPRYMLLERLSALQTRYPHHEKKAFQTLRSAILDSDDTALIAAENNLLDSIYRAGEGLVAERKLLQAHDMFKKLKGTRYDQKSEEQIGHLGEIFCREKRKKAALQFSYYMKQQNDSLKVRNLRAAAKELDSCLVNFPDLEISKKAGKNRNLIQERLESLVGQ